MKITFNFIEIGNAAFQDDAGFKGARSHEIARIMRKAVDKFEGDGIKDGSEFVLYDYNGNSVGACTVKGK
jgi:hypothetical protein